MVKKKFHDSVFYKINPISGKHHMMFFVAIAIIICAAVCVMPVVAAGEHDHDGWIAWTTTNSLPTIAGHYYLDTDVTLSSDWLVPTGDETHLCLNDRVINLGGAKHIIISSGANLSLYDCGDTIRYYTQSGSIWKLTEGPTDKITTGGIITGGSMSEVRGGAILINYGGEFIMHGGNIVGNKVSKNSGGGLYVFGTATMYGGSIIGNWADYGGGGMEIGQQDNSKPKGILTMYGGNISYNTGQDGGGICAWAGDLVMYGGNITMNKLDTNRNGAGIYLDGGGEMVVSGVVDISGNTKLSNGVENVKLAANHRITIGEVGLQADSSIGVTSVDSVPVQITNGGSIEEADYFFADVGGNIEPRFSGGNIWLKDISDEWEHHHDDLPEVEWTRWRGSISPASAAGYYALSEDITFNHNWNVAASGDTWLCLNGSVLNLNGYRIIVPENANLTICDCKYGDDEHTHYFDRPESVVSFWNDTIITEKRKENMVHNYLWVLNDSNISSPYTVKGGVITNARSEAIHGGAISVANKSNLTLLSGNIAGNNLNQTDDPNGAGGAIHTLGTFTMYNGNITGNVAGAGGAGVQVAGVSRNDNTGVFIMYGGNITENYSPRFGGGVTGWAAGTWEMHGGLISNNTADRDGGGVFIEHCVFDMYNGLISNNYAGFGGGVCVINTVDNNNQIIGKGFFNMSGGTVTNNNATKYGGGLSPFAKLNAHINTYGTVTFYDSGVPIIIEGNKKWNDSKGDYDRCNFYIAEGHISNLIAGDVLPAGSYIGVKPDPKLTTLIEIPVANTTRYENEIYFHADLEGEFEPFFDGDTQQIYLHSKSEVDGNFTRCEGHHLNHTELGEDIKWYDWNGTGNLMPRHSGYYVMTRDITLTDEMLDYHDPELGGNYDVWNITGEVIHICLNGHVLNLNNSRIRVSSKFIINDCNHDNGVHYFKTEDDGMWNLSDESDYHDIVYGGVITGNTKRVNTYANGPEIKEHGGAIRTVNGSVLFKNGTIVGNRAAVGGGIYVQGGNLTMVNGTIAGNAATDSGGGVEIKDLGRFEMRGGTVKNNTVLTAENGILQKGGGVCLGVNQHDDLVYFIMSGGVIKNNKVGTPENPGFGSGVFVDSRGEISMSGDATVDRSNEFYLSNISQPVQIFGDTFTGGILNINGTVYNKTGHAMYTKIIQVTDESFAHGINASGILRQFDVGDVPKSLGAVLKADSDETNKFILVDYEEPVDPDYYVKINQNADNATITLEGMDKTEDDIYPVTVGTDVRIITHLANPRYVFCNYTVKKETSEEIVETHNVSRNETYSIRNFTMEPDNIVVNATFGLRGDADYNGVVDIVDAACVGVHIIRDEDNHLITPDTNGYFCADVNSNNDIDVIDLYEINRYLVGIITYPGEEMHTNPFEHPEAEQNQNELQENG